MKLPNPENAYIDDHKLTGYFLNPNHPEGQHKARVFKSALDLDLNHLESHQLKPKVYFEQMSLHLAIALASYGIEKQGIIHWLDATGRAGTITFTAAFIASPLHKLFPNSFSRWLLKNQKIINVSFRSRINNCQKLRPIAIVLRRIKYFLIILATTTTLKKNAVYYTAILRCFGWWRLFVRH